MHLELEVLNNFLGDRPMTFDTDTEEGRQKLVDEFKNLLKHGTAIWLERPGVGGEIQTLRVTGFDPATDSLKVQVPVPQPKEGGRPCVCQKCEGCTNNVRDASRTGICSACQQGKHGGKTIEVKAKPRRSDRVSAIGPRAGG